MAYLEAAHDKSRIDRFSTLPNELVDAIHDLIYPDHPFHLIPPSKRFLPFYRDRLFRKVILHTSNAVTVFADSLNEDLVTGGGRVRSIEFRATTLPATARSSIDGILQMCANILSLSCLSTRGPVYWSIFERAKWGSGFRNLRQLTVPWFDDPKTFHPKSLLWLNKLQQLDDLTIFDFPDFRVVPDTYDLDLKIRYFTLVGKGAAGSGAELILRRLKAVRVLRIIRPADAPGGSDVEPALRALQSPLESLTLSHARCNVATFSRFESLHTLDTDCFFHPSRILSRTSELPATVSTLRTRWTTMLEDFSFITNFVNSRDNPDCHKQLRCLEVNLIPEGGGNGGGGGRIGSRITPELVEDPNWNDDDILDPNRNESDILATHWDLPLDVYWAQHPTYRAFKRRRVNDQAFELTGTLVDAVETTDALLLELHNRAVLSKYLDRDVGDIPGAKASLIAGYHKPSIEIEEGERADLEIVRDYLPERKWFALSLRNRSNGNVYGRWN